MVINEAPAKAAFRVAQAAEYIGLSRPTVYRLMDSGDLPSIHIGRRRLILRKDIDAYLEPLSK